MREGERGARGVDEGGRRERLGSEKRPKDRVPASILKLLKSKFSSVV